MDSKLTTQILLMALATVAVYGYTTMLTKALDFTSSATCGLPTVSRWMLAITSLASLVIVGVCIALLVKTLI